MGVAAAFVSIQREKKTDAVKAGRGTEFRRSRRRWTSPAVFPHFVPRLFPTRHSRASVDFDDAIQTDGALHNEKSASSPFFFSSLSTGHSSVRFPNQQSVFSFRIVRIIHTHTHSAFSTALIIVPTSFLLETNDRIMAPLFSSIQDIKRRIIECYIKKSIVARITNSIRA